eukprot:2780442-Pyramimonas_sp.AAC.1
MLARGLSCARSFDDIGLDQPAPLPSRWGNFRGEGPNLSVLKGREIPAAQRTAFPRHVVAET